jgi:DNA-binding MarR family transcriptional regulator
VNQSRSDAEQQLHEQLIRIWHRHTAAAALLDESETALDPVAQLLLRMIDARGPVRSSDLAEQIGLSRPAISRRIAALESAGLVASVRDPHDGRASLLTVSGEGKARIAKIARSGAATVSDLVTDFTTEELRTLAALLGRFNESASARRAATTPTKEPHVPHADH